MAFGARQTGADPRKLGQIQSSRGARARRPLFAAAGKTQGRRRMTLIARKCELNAIFRWLGARLLVVSECGLTKPSEAFNVPGAI